jgi:hypothetical protein
MNEDESTKLRHHLRREVVQTWIWTAAVAVLVAAILVEHARGGELMDCEPQPASGDGRHWAYRIIHGRECWYPGERGKPKLRWTEAPSAPQQSGMLKQSEGEVSLPEPAPQQPGVVERSEVEGSPRKPILDLAAASPEPGIEGMPEEWRAAAPTSCSPSPAAGRSCRRPSRSHSRGPDEHRTSRRLGR